MGKKISIDMDEDGQVAIEINGVHYSSLDEIPDADDLKKVEAMLTQISEGEDHPQDDEDEESDAEFDRNFQKQFDEFERESKKFPVLVFAIFFGVALIMLAVAVFSGYQSVQAKAREVASPAKVVDLVKHRSVDSETEEVTIYTYPGVEFTSPDGKTHHVETNEGSSPPSHQLNDAVTVLYDPANPEDVSIQSFAHSLLFWLVPAITGFLGVVFLSIAVAIWWIFRKKQDASPYPAGM
jgi:uncharacterized membrane protein